MSSAHERKKQPELVRRNLLEWAAKLTVEQGVAGVSVQAVADAAGVTKGGLFHHFPSKQSLLDAVFDDALGKFDEEIETLISQDCEAYGCFTRAYVDAAFADLRRESASPWVAISGFMLGDAASKTKWNGWVSERSTRHAVTDSNLQLEIIRLAVDGIWLSTMMSGGINGIAHLTELHQRLIEGTRGHPTS